MTMQSLRNWATYVVIGLMVATSVPQDACAQSVPGRADIVAAEGEAAELQRFADDRARIARDYRELAATATRNAGEAVGREQQADWRQTASRHLQQAQRLGSEARDARMRAEEAAERARSLRAAYEAARAAEPVQASDDAAPVERVESILPGVKDVVGIWRDTGDDLPFVIRQSDPDIAAWSYKLTAQTMARTWTGTFSALPEGDIRRLQDSLLRFSHAPSKEEMNPDIPEWAREAVEGELTWSIELDAAGTCGSPRLEGVWFPGEVTWQENDDGIGRSAWVSGQGEPRPVELAPSIGFDVSMFAAPQVRLRVPGLPSPSTRLVESLIKGQPFYVELLLPEDQASQVGDSVDISITSASGESYALSLARTASPAGSRKLYTHLQPVRFGDETDILEYGRYDANVLSLNQGSVLGFEVANAEEVRFSHGDAFQRVHVFDTLLSRAIARQDEALELMRAIFADLVSNEALDAELRRNAQRRLQMVRNAQELLGLRSALTPPQRYAAAQRYLGPDGTGGLLLQALGPEVRYELVEGSSAAFEWYDEASADQRSPYRHSDNVIWTSRYEQIAVARAIQNARPDKDVLLNQAVHIMAFATYDFLADVTPAGDLTIALFGHDRRGERKDVTDRLYSVLKLASVDLGLPVAFRKFDTAYATSEARIARLGARMRSDAALRIGMRKMLPRGVSPNDLQSARAAREGELINCAPRGIPRRAELPGEIPPPPALPDALPDVTVNPPPMNPDAALPPPVRYYGPNVVAKNPDAPLSPHRQTRQNCQCQVVAWQYEKSTGMRVSEDEVLFLMKRMKLADYAARQPEIDGFSDLEVDNLVHVLGGHSTVSANYSLEQMDALLKRGADIKNAIDLKEFLPGIDNPKHAVGLNQINRNAQGEIVEVEFFDPAFGQVLKLPACEYVRLINSPNIRNNSQVILWGNP